MKRTPNQQTAKDLGREGEELAAAYLRQKGLQIVARNWRHGRYELDIVCRDADTLVFVEVRTRRHSGMVHPLETLTPKKIRAFLKAVHLYLFTTKQWQTPCRCDLVCVQTNTIASALPLWKKPFQSFLHTVQPHIEHHIHVIEYSATMAGRHTSW